jgi:hypothetical protein
MSKSKLAATDQVCIERIAAARSPKIQRRPSDEASAISVQSLPINGLVFLVLHCLLQFLGTT